MAGVDSRIHEAFDELHIIYGDVGEQFGEVGQSALLEALEEVAREVEVQIEQSYDASGPSNYRQHDEESNNFGDHDFF